jgi:hypothetical protein
MNRSGFSRFAFLLVAAILLTVSAASASGPYQFYSVTPCRIVDTRVANMGAPALVSYSPRSFKITNTPCGIPPEAKAVAFNVTAVSPTLGGFFTVWPYNTALPGISTINFNAGEAAIANGAIVPLSSDPSLQISVVYGTSVAGGSAHVIFDVTGYFACPPGQICT